MQLYNKHDIDILNEKIGDLEKEVEIYKLENIYPTKDKIMGAINIVLEYVKENKRIIYGGTAQNMLVKIKNKDDAFYGDYEVPDIDFYSYEPVIDVKKICNRLHDAGFKEIAGQEAQHDETYTIFAEYKPVADITYVPKYIYDNIPNVTINGIKYANHSFVMIDLFRMLIEPLFSNQRWTKALNRLYLLQKHYPYNKATKALPYINTMAPNIKNEISKLLNTVYGFLENNETTIIIGEYSYNHYLKESGIMEDKKLGKKYRILDISHYQFVSTDYRKDGKKLLELLKKNHPSIANDIVVVEHYPFWQFNGYSAYIKYKNHVFCRIIHYNHRCTPIKKVDKIQLGTFHYVFMMVLVATFWNKINKMRQEVNYYNIMTSHLIEMRNYYLKKNKKTMFDDTIFQSFIPTCTGDAEDPFIHKLRREHKKWKARKIFRYKPADTYEKEPESKFLFANTSGNAIRNPKNLRIVTEIPEEVRATTRKPRKKAREV